jgi:cell division protein FtsA
MNEYGRLEVLGLGQAPCSGVVRGVVTNIDRTVDAIVKAINEAETQANVNILEVNVSISGQQIRSIRERTGFTRLSADKEITVEDVMRLNEDMRRIQPPVGNQILHVVPQDYSVDYASGIYDPVGMLGVKLEGDFHVITAPFAAIANIQKCIEKADRLLGKRGQLKIGERVLEPIAAGMAVLMDEEKEAGVAMVDIGGDTTDIAIFHKNIIRHTSVIPFGGNIVTRDIEEGCTIQAKYAELLKIRFGLALSEPASWNEVVSIPVLPGRPPKEISIKNLAYIIEARMEEIVEMIYAELSRAGYDRLTGGIVLTGGGSQLQYLRELFELTTGLHTRIGNPNQHMGRTQNEAV